MAKLLWISYSFRVRGIVYDPIPGARHRSRRTGILFAYGPRR